MSAAKRCITCGKPFIKPRANKITHSKAEDANCRRAYKNAAKTEERREEVAKACAKGHTHPNGPCDRCQVFCRPPRKVGAIKPRAGWKTREKGDEKPNGLPTADALAAAEERRRNARKLTKEERLWLDIVSPDASRYWAASDLEAHWALRKPEAPVAEVVDLDEYRAAREFAVEEVA
jgi:hypothetical protein